MTVTFSPPMVVKASRKLSWLLRHGASEAGVKLDAAGWAEIVSVLNALNMDRELFDAVVEQNNKKRFTVEGSRVRAEQGHSGAIVDLDAIEASWTPFEGPGPIWHGTGIEPLASIAREGLLPQKRTHVHMVEAKDSVAGKRSAVDVLLEIDVSRMKSRKQRIFRSENGVVLARAVPKECIVDVVPMTARAREQLPELRRTLGL
jgi:putative RNA 2'-phosphotransferase